jgi:hypothetical protein
VNGGLPATAAMNFDQVLDSIWMGNGMTLSTSLEPDPKPAYLNSRDNNMIGWSGTYPTGVPRGVGTDPVSGTVILANTCATHISPPWPTGYFNLCGQ